MALIVATECTVAIRSYRDTGEASHAICRGKGYSEEVWNERQQSGKDVREGPSQDPKTDQSSGASRKESKDQPRGGSETGEGQDLPYRGLARI